MRCGTGFAAEIDAHSFPSMPAPLAADMDGIAAAAVDVAVGGVVACGAAQVGIKKTVNGMGPMQGEEVHGVIKKAHVHCNPQKPKVKIKCCHRNKNI